MKILDNRSKTSETYLTAFPHKFCLLCCVGRKQNLRVVEFK